MKKINVILAALTLFGLMTGCNSNKSQNATDEAQAHGITMTLKAKAKVKFSLAGYDTAYIDWGDGSPIETVILNPMQDIDYGDDFVHNYAKPSEYTIKITGKDIKSFNGSNIEITNLDVSKSAELKVLNCTNNLLKSLDVSNNLALQELYCGANQLTSLDVSKNTELTKYLSVYASQMSAEALNALFKALSYGSSESTLFIVGNPGTYTCDLSIAEKKGWTVIDYEDEE